MRARSIVQRLVSPALAAALASPTIAATSLAPTVAVAAAPAPANDDDAALAEARAMFERGRAKYDTFDYEGAIDLWQQAMQKVPESQAGVRNAMVYNIALAQEKAYDVDKDVAHLRQAVLLLEQWVSSYKAMFKKTPETEAEAAKAEARIAELKDRIGKIEAGEETTTAPASDEVPAPGSAIAFDTGYTPPPEVMREQQKAKASNKSEGFIAAGWTLGGIGALIFLGGVGGIVGTVRADERAGLGASIGITIFGAGMIATGGALLGQGYKQKKAIEQGQYSLAPYFDRNGGGAAFTGRF